MVKTRSRAKAEEKFEREYLFARPSDDEVRELQRNFVQNKPIRLRRKPVLREPSARRKVTPSMVKKIYELHYNLKYSFVKLGKILHCPPATAHHALSRFEAMDGQLVDRRIFNGTKNGRLKIFPRVSKYLLDPTVL